MSDQTGPPDGDPGDPTTAGTTAPASGDAVLPSLGATPAVSEAEAAIASRIPATLADEEATDEAPGIDPTKPVVSQPGPAAAPKPAATAAKAQTQPSLWKWVLGGVVALLIAIFLRAKLRAGGTGSSVR